MVSYYSYHERGYHHGHESALALPHFVHAREGARAGPREGGGACFSPQIGYGACTPQIDSILCVCSIKYTVPAACVHV